MTVTTNQVICPSNAAVEVVPATNPNLGSSTRRVFRKVLLFNPSVQDIYVGGPGVTSATGLVVKAGAAPIPIELMPNEDLWGIGASNSPTLQYFESGT